MEHILDNPVWNALISGNQLLSLGTETARYFPEEISPFVGFQTYIPENFRILHEQLEQGIVCTLVFHKEITVPKSWEIIRHLKVLQMVHYQSEENYLGSERIVPLSQKHIPDMLQLTELTRPGPFERGTIHFGHYEGIFLEEKLIAMAGQRLHPAPFVEISAVCTHPDHTGEGLASLLIRSQIHRIRSSSAIPFLHVTLDNRAIHLYRKLGFRERTELHIYIIKKP